MDAARPSHPLKLLSLQETARRLRVSVDTLLSWNEHHILTPKITKDGTVGYLEEQIAYFESIQESLKQPSPSVYPQAEVKPLLQTPVVHYSPPTYSPSHLQANKPFHTSRLFMVLSLVGTVGVILVISQGSQISFLVNQFTQYQNQTANQEKVLGTQTSTLQFTPVNTFSSSVALNGDDSKNKQLHDEGKNTAFVFVDQPKFAKTNNSTSSGQVLGKHDVYLEKPVAMNGSTSAKFAAIAAAVSSNPPSTLSTFSTSDQGSFHVDLGTLNTTNTIKNDTVTTTAAVGILGIMFFVLQSQLAVFGRRPLKGHGQSFSHKENAQRIIELEQKMDGSVVALFQGKEYKICKPELYSDSDQFIERLMELTSSDEKEIEYDSFTDARLRLSTPLSRLVTRLNFVGLKRDLFFPRTSKNRVLFRRYITYQDLMTMNVTVNNVLSDLTRVA